ncbi:protein serine/threonine kinase isoform X2 [Wolffia australiana]
MTEEEEEEEEVGIASARRHWIACPECLERQIRSDFAGDLVFRHVVAESPFPFGDSAVIEINLPKREGDSTRSDRSDDEVAAQFVIVALHDLEFFPDTGYSLPSEERIPPSESIQLQEQANVGVCINDNTFSSEWKTRFIPGITALSPDTYIGSGSYSTLLELIRRYLFGSIEEHVMTSINLFLDGRACEPHVTDFFSSIGFPNFIEKETPSCVRHPNICPVLGVLKSSSCTYLLQPKFQFALESILNYSPRALKSSWHIEFITYQLLSAMNCIHSLGLAHGNIRPSKIMLTDSGWSYLSLCDRRNNDLAFKKAFLSSRKCCYAENCSCQAIWEYSRLSSPVDWGFEFKRWQAGELSNYEYLISLNRMAGRRWGDQTFHMVMPWVIDFSVKPDQNSDVGWRDLQKSKWRLAKGDEQLDFTYLTSEIPHHVSDECLSELAVCSYKARRLPLSVLRSAVRSVYEPNEYPSNMQRLYQWTPDECIPEFYCDPRIFYSIHPEMSDLRVPSWAESPEDFIKVHREALESDRVSRQIHHWIDITFGHKLSGASSIAAKNVMLPTVDPMTPKSTGRRQLFTTPHPNRQCSGKKSLNAQMEKPIEHAALENENADVLSSEDCSVLPATCYIDELEESISFSVYAHFLNPVYSLGENLNQKRYVPKPSDKKSSHGMVDSENSSLALNNVNLSSLLDSFEDDIGFKGSQDFLCLEKHFSESACLSEDTAEDMFSFGCTVAELYLKKPLFDSASISVYAEKDIMPGIIRELPVHVRLLVESCIQKNWRRRPSAKSILESEYFSPGTRSVYSFVAPIHYLSTSTSRLQYASKLGNKGALRAMGPLAVEMCAPFCLPLILSPLSDAESEASISLLSDFMRSLKFPAVKFLIVPIIQRILQIAGCTHLKVSILQDSFMRKVWKYLGQSVYLEKVHPLVISNICNCPNKSTASAASVLLIGSSEELGIPITIHQTVFPLVHLFGKGLAGDGIDALVRIGGLHGEDFIARHLLPILKNVVISCLDSSSVHKSEAVQSWKSFVLTDCFITLDGLAKFLDEDILLKEFISDEACLHIKVLCQANLDLSVFQVVATALVSVCQRVGPESTASYILPQLKRLFDELAVSQECMDTRSSRKISASSMRLQRENRIDTRVDIVSVLYPPLASLIGIERLRQSCTTWFLLEQFLEMSYGWKWELLEEAPQSESIGKAISSAISSSGYNPAKLLLTGAGWSVPQTQPWFWFPGTAAYCDGLDFLARAGGPKDDSWKVKASILWATRAHHGTLRSLAVSDDECTVFTGGVGPGFKGIVEKWELSRMNCISGYYGHDEVVNDIAILSLTERVASCDGTIHVWSSHTGKLISSFVESSTSSSPVSSKVNEDLPQMLPSNSATGIYSNALSGSMYTCMYYLSSDDLLIAGMGSGCIRFIDVAQGRKLHLWKVDTVEHSLSSIVSAICSCDGSGELQADSTPRGTRWLAVGLSSGHCRLLDTRSGELVALWRAHDGYITQLASPEDHTLISSSLDRTLRIWDMRRNLSSQSNVFAGHSDGISRFAVWGQNMISISKNKIGLSSFSGLTSNRSQVQRGMVPLKLHSSDKMARNQSNLTAISILPFSRLFLVGTEDGHLKVCC